MNILVQLEDFCNRASDIEASCGKALDITLFVVRMAQTWCGESKLEFLRNVGTEEMRVWESLPIS
jgi:hypothetical protein